MTAHEDILKEARRIDTNQASDGVQRVEPARHAAPLQEQQGMTESLRDFVSENPGPAVLIGAGLAWLFVNRERNRSRSLPTRMRERAHNVSASTKESLEQARAGTAETFEKAKDATSHKMEDVKDFTHDKAIAVSNRYKIMLEENPLALGASALAAGLVIGLLIPSSRRENELLGEARDSLMDQALSIVNEARNAAVASLRSSRDSVEEKLLEVKDEVQGAVQDSVDQAKQAFQEETHSENNSAKKKKGNSMNSDTVEGQWKQMKGKARQQWGKLTDDDLDRVQGKREELTGLVQEKYGYARDQAKKEVDDFFEA